MLAHTIIPVETVTYYVEPSDDEQEPLYYDLALHFQSFMPHANVGVLRDRSDPKRYVVAFSRIPDEVYDAIPADECRVKLTDGQHVLRWKSVCSGGPVSIQYNPVTDVVEAQE